MSGDLCSRVLFRLAAATLIASASPARAAGSIEVCVFSAPDVPTIESLTGQRILPNEIFEYEGNPPAYTKVLTLPEDVHVAGLFKLDAAGSWLFSSTAPTLAGSQLASTAESRDIVRRDGSGAYTKFFCGASVTGVVPSGSAIDAFYLEGGDGGDLIVSFDVPTIIGLKAFQPADLVRYLRTPGGSCSSWQIAAANPIFDSTTAGGGVPPGSNSVGASKYAGRQVFAQDIPTQLSPPGISVVPGQIVSWDGSQYSVLATLVGWPISSLLHGVSNPGNPGVIGNGLRVNKSTVTPGHLVLSWTASCSSNAEETAIYEGTLGSWYSHASVTCTDAGDDRVEEITPQAGNKYYLVVPTNPQGEGSYGTRSTGAERPQGSNVCVPAQALAACPS